MKEETVWRLNGIGGIFRFLTPIMLTISLFILGQIWTQLSDLNAKLYVHVTNSDIHIPKSELVRIEFQISEMRKDVIATIRDVKR